MYSTRMQNNLRHTLDGQSEAANHTVHFQGGNKHWARYLRQQSKESDQISQQMDSIQGFQSYMLHTLSTPLQDHRDGFLKQGHAELLTKIRTLSAFGTTVWQWMNLTEHLAKPEV
ncbi:hypothetical protein [Serratia proteamaculans]|uniref:hypothetical protein n=1 Tax=Serratia proteamaculans TaxID=28151 RepID=UPI001F10DAA2|nr:hypothetical protein [Serratia proteamaculans]